METQVWSDEKPTIRVPAYVPAKDELAARICEADAQIQSLLRRKMNLLDTYEELYGKEEAEALEVEQGYGCDNCQAHKTSIHCEECGL